MAAEVAKGVLRLLPNSREYSRILVTLLSSIGDTLFATPTIHTLRQRYPRAYIASAVYSSNKAVLEDNPDMDEIFWHLPQRLDWIRILWTMRRRRFELAVDLCTFSLFLLHRWHLILAKAPLPEPPVFEGGRCFGSAGGGGQPAQGWEIGKAASGGNLSENP